MEKLSTPTIFVPETPTQQTIGNRTITLKPNANQASPAMAVIQFLKTDEGLFRFGQLGERLPNFMNAIREQYGKVPSRPLDDCAKKSFQSWTWLTTIPRAITMTPGVIADVQDAAEAWNNQTLGLHQKRYKVEKAVREVTDAAAMYSYSVGNVASLFPSMSKLYASCLASGVNFTAVHDAASLHLNVENMARALTVDISKTTPEIASAVKYTIRRDMIATLKDIVALAPIVFGMLAFVTGVAVMPALAVATCSLASTAFGTLRKLYEDTLPFKPISFLDNRHVALITT
jgi:hypothetical protein